MKSNSILSIFLAGFMACSAVSVEAAKPLRRPAATKRTTTTATAPAKVATELPAGFGITSLMFYNPEWECYTFREDASKALLQSGFTVLKKGRTKEWVGSDPGGYQSVTYVTYGFEGIKVTLLRNNRVDKIVFPNKQTLDQFIATALDSGNYRQYEEDSTYYQNKTGLGSFRIKGLKIVFDWAP